MDDKTFEQRVQEQAAFNLTIVKDGGTWHIADGSYLTYKNGRWLRDGKRISATEATAIMWAAAERQVTEAEVEDGADEDEVDALWESTPEPRTTTVADAALLLERSEYRVRDMIRKRQLDATTAQVLVGHKITKIKGKPNKSEPIYRRQVRITLASIKAALAAREAKATKVVEPAAPSAPRANSYIITLTPAQLEGLQEAMQDEGWEGLFEGVTIRRKNGDKRLID